MTGIRSPRRLLMFGCWLPSALWAVTLLYVRRYDGWGAWAAAPLLLPGLLVSLLWAAAGVFTLGRMARRGGGVDYALLGATLVGGAPVFYYALRYFLRQV